MGIYKYIREVWKQPKANLGLVWKQRLISWREEPAQIRLEHPTRIDRARAAGYKAKPGVFVVRTRLRRGSFFRPKDTMAGGRRSAHAGRIKNVGKNYQAIAEERVADHYPNCEVLNSYYVGHDGKHQWFEVILVDTSHPSVLADKDLAWLAKHRSRVYRGLTSAGNRFRGLRWKGKGAEKMRPSLGAHGKRGK
ncbi:MAG: 50S ribosomal protein L15e [Nanoarchaeota archaeon]